VGDAYDNCNRLSPGEVLTADDSDRGFRKLNIIVDEWSADQTFLYQSVFTSAAQTGNITLAAGAWAALPIGTELRGIWQNDIKLDELRPERFASLVTPISSGQPQYYTYDGRATISFSPVPNGQTIKILTGKGVASFADLTTDYIMPPGYRAALGATLAVALAPVVMGNIPDSLLKFEKRAMFGIKETKAAILDSEGYSSIARHGDISNGWF
jgi:hypothetical protein